MPFGALRTYSLNRSYSGIGDKQVYVAVYPEGGQDPDQRVKGWIVAGFEPSKRSFRYACFERQLVLRDISGQTEPLKFLTNLPCDRIRRFVTSANRGHI
ncbi:hypothetical protein AGR4C_pa50023 [Agrobacterium tumefaciens str. Kerr 14]|uniref:Uncharacterized protein n=1 Tax=Agrobacterium tumefaciens str. Kerr 14 TaxID=1183424 RepID=A0A1S7SAZ5_AGRTU|nr:hypothetical protein AGR4C_pa50023 [Agrobacterium tumefaciens str. Kerr 14]